LRASAYWLKQVSRKKEVGNMLKPYTIHIFVVDGDPEGVKIVYRQNWTGWGIAFPRSTWPKISKRPDTTFVEHGSG